MLKCPNCAEPISPKISQEGGPCPRCAHFILPFGDEFEYEASDTQERMPTNDGFDDSDLELIAYDETEEYEVTELITRPGNYDKGSVADFDYQEDFSEIDNEGSDIIVVRQEKRPPPKRSNSLIFVGILSVIMLVLGGYVFSLRMPEQKAQSKIKHLGISYEAGGVPFEDPGVRKAREDALAQALADAEAKAEAEERKKEERKRAASVYVEKELDPQLENVLDLRLGMFTQCVDHAIMKSSQFKATVRYRLTVEVDGSVSESSISVSGEKPEKFERCLNKAIKKWRFPKTAERVSIDRKFVVD
jgi:hypothetical protein